MNLLSQTISNGKFFLFQTILDQNRNALHFGLHETRKPDTLFQPTDFNLPNYYTHRKFIFIKAQLKNMI